MHSKIDKILIAFGIPVYFEHADKTDEEKLDIILDETKKTRENFLSYHKAVKEKLNIP